MHNSSLTLEQQLRLQLDRALMECERLKKENVALKKQLGLLSREIPSKLQIYSNEMKVTITHAHSRINNYSSPEEKIAVYRSIFRGREDVFAKRWEAKNERGGYSPTCANEWSPVCKKPTVKCTDCAHRAFLPVTDQVIYDHLSGKHTVGIYPLLQDDTCWFLATDFDKKSWKEDVTMFLDTCKQFNLPTYIERSRSGNGAHVWIFFAEPILAFMARKLGFFLLKHTMEKTTNVGFDSYDRLFPNQDRLPKGGFGNLIALPLQGESRKNGNTLFVDSTFQPFKDQWSFLSSVKRLSENKIVQLIAHSEQDKNWCVPIAQLQIEDALTPNELSLVRSNMLHLSKQVLSPALCHRLKQLAVFHNPEFYKAQRMRLSTSAIPSMIDCNVDNPKYLAMPRGCYSDVIKILNEEQIEVSVRDERFAGETINVNFVGELRPLQLEAANALLSHDNGVLSATTAFGKTVLAAYLIGARKVNTLILVHRKQLLEQWKEQLASFLDIPIQSIGSYGGGKNKRSGIVMGTQPITPPDAPIIIGPTL